MLADEADFRWDIVFEKMAILLIARGCLQNVTGGKEVAPLAREGKKILVVTVFAL